MLGVLATGAVTTGWAGWQALQVRGDLTAAQAIVTRLQAGIAQSGAAPPAAELPALRILVDRAAGRTQGPAWSVAEHLPLLGSNFQAVRQTALAVQILGDRALPEARAALDLIHHERPIHDGQVNLAVLPRLAVHVERAAQALDAAQALLAPPDGFVLGPVRAKVDLARVKVDALDAGLHSAATALRLAPGMLGQRGPRRYFVAVQNNAEARATGGLVGAFALVRTDHGSITLEHAASDIELQVATTSFASDPAAARTWTDVGSKEMWQDSNLTPHFPDAARNMAGLWAAQSGQQVDGVIALDPLVMSELLAAAGAVHLPDGTSITAANVVDFVGHDEYVRYHDNDVRKALLAGLAKDLFHQVTAVKDPLRTLRAFASASATGHLYFWSADSAEQSTLATGIVGGALPSTDTPYLGVLTQNLGGNKLDYYLRRKVRVTRQADGVLQVQVTLRNTAPTGLPGIMSGREDYPKPPVPYGQNKLGFSIYGALSTTVRGVQIDGRPAPMRFDRDHGHQMGTMSLELPRHQDVVVTVLLTEPAGELVYRQQPLMAPDVLAIEVPHRVVGR